MRSFNIFFGFLFISINCFSQFRIDWLKTYGGSGVDEVGYSLNIYDAAENTIVKTDDGGYLIAGSSNSNNGPFTGNNGSNDFALLKLDAQGNRIWSRLYGTNLTNLTSSIIKTIDGNFMLLGYAPNAFSYFDCVLIKIDNNGDSLWYKTFSRGVNVQPFSIVASPDGGFYVGGVINPGAADKDIWLCKLDSLGDLQWEKFLGGSDQDWLNSLILTTDNNLVMCGYSESYDGDVSINYGLTDIWILKTDTLGNIIWQKTFGGVRDDQAFSVIETSDTCYAIACRMDYSGVTGDNYVIKLDVSGNTLWRKYVSSWEDEMCGDIIETPNHELLILGSTSCFINDPANVIDEISHGEYDINLTKLDLIYGFDRGSTNFGGSLSDFGMSIIYDGNNEFVIAGISKSNDFDFSVNNGDYDIAILKVTESFNTITGKIYIDYNSNSVFDSGDVPISNQIIQDSTSQRVAMSDVNGDFEFLAIDTGTYTISPTSLNYYNVIPSSHTVVFNSAGHVEPNKDFAATLIPGFADLQINMIPLRQFRRGMNSSYEVTAKNVGSDSLGGYIRLVLDSYLTFISSTIIPDQIIGDTLIWNSISLTSQQKFTVNIEFNVDLSAFTGQAIVSSAIIFPSGGVVDNDTTNNLSVFSQNITGSFDPNDKSASLNNIEQGQISNPPYIDYAIRFQNTGNDTAFNITVYDTLSYLLDHTTFEVINTSHNVFTTYNYQTRILTFTFSDILLPDSNTNESLSHGFIHYRIKPVSNLSVGSVISNRASILFDFNAFITTNAALTEVTTTSNIYEIKSDFNFGILINPVRNDLVILSDNKNTANCEVAISVFNSIGIEVYRGTIMFSNQETRIPFSNMPSGVYSIVGLYEGATKIKKFIKLE